MREIEFRAKVKRSLQLEQIKNGWIHGGIFENKIISRNTNEGSICAGFCSEVEIIPETVGQFTGLKDKNGKKIFEGDIGWDEHNECYGVVKFEEGKFLYVWENIAEDLREVADSIEIYGNIHENPDLLEVME
ncbi:hypothetical protein BLH47_06505 [Listeria monocytogenes]|uniref:YopX family protein n=1 Tax=Listeria monocytogenes TaxID=1639 RepID=UPI0015DB4CF9|nr:YopX family protein [Listeria monocytogenes]EAG7433653.1 hypothetical protein [Listeria monocytogenes]HAB7843164.1 hypothetical protein [Listeria monocytogenes]HAM0959186.1 hypothetical protein [Listeria monocytogenes]HAM1699064.1 hypothetical protein [Listeria monocytogenes]HAM1727547.1 hypothetical protein [Listeria monocytogenes]